MIAPRCASRVRYAHDTSSRSCGGRRGASAFPTQRIAPRIAASGKTASRHKSLRVVQTAHLVLRFVHSAVLRTMHAGL
jgi:hypothetical protein